MTDKYNGARFVYVAARKKGITTIAYRYNDANKQIEFEFARCSRRDSFSKRNGRLISNGRLKAHPFNMSYKMIVDEGSPRLKDIIPKVLQAVAELDKMPRRLFS